MDTELQRAIRTIQNSGQTVEVIKKLFNTLPKISEPNNVVSQKNLINVLLSAMNPKEVCDLPWGSGLADVLRQMTKGLQVELIVHLIKLWRPETAESHPLKTVIKAFLDGDYDIFLNIGIDDDLEINLR